jgi:hypothetical protein
LERTRILIQFSIEPSGPQCSQIIAGPFHIGEPPLHGGQMTVAAQMHLHLMTEGSQRSRKMMETAIRTLDQIALLRVAFANK